MHRLASIARLLALVAISAAGSGGIAAAQPYGTDLILGDHTGNLFRVGPSGTTTLGNYAPSGRFLWDVTIDATNQDAILSVAPSGLSTGELVSVDLTNGQATTIATGVGSVLTRLDENGDYVVSTRPNVLRVDRNGQVIETLYTAITVPLADRDVSTGNWVIAELTRLLHYDPATQSVVRTVSITASGHMSLATDPASTDMFVGNFALHRIDTQTGATTSLPPFLGLGPVGDQAMAIDRAAGPSGELLYVYQNANNQNGVLHVDRAGTVVASLGPFTNQITGIAFEHSQNLASQVASAPNDRSLFLSFPGFGGLGYATAFSLSGSVPGVRLPDGRQVALNLDALSALTLSGNLPPLVRDNIGTLDANGRAVVSLNLNALGSAVSGARLWAVAVVFDPNAPLGLAVISSPWVIVL